MGRISGLAGVAWLACIAGCTASSGPERPNVVLLVLDTVRADALSSYGDHHGTTPHLDRLAGEGARFTRAYSTDFWTLPSHASLFTGQYPSAHGATSETNRLSSQRETVAEVLRRAGYRTGAFVSNPWVTLERGFAQGFETFVEVWRRQPGVPPADQGAIALATRFLDAQEGDDRPFLLFLNLNTAHMPYDPDPEALTRLQAEPIQPERRQRLSKITGTWRYLAGQEDLDAEDFRVLRTLYRAEVTMVDDLVGRLVEELRARDLLDDSLVVVASDHGENLGEHGMIDHMLSLYDTTTRIPLIVRYPARIEAGRVDDRLASLVDVAATILDACGLDDGLLEGPGRSLLDPAPVPHPFVIAENERPVNGVELLNGAFPDYDTTEIDRPMRMLRDARYKLVWRGGDLELYDLDGDPAEERNLADSLPDVREALRRQLEVWMEGHRQDAPQAGFESRDLESLEELRALGYVE